MNKLIHALVLAVFGIACCLVWGLLTVTTHIQAGGGIPLPAFTSLCVGLRPVALALPVVAATYCLFVWIRKKDERRSWVGFFAATMCALVLVALPAVVAAYLPLVDSINHLASR